VIVVGRALGLTTIGFAKNVSSSAITACDAVYEAKQASTFKTTAISSTIERVRVGGALVNAGTF